MKMDIHREKGIPYSYPVLYDNRRMAVFYPRET